MDIHARVSWGDPLDAIRSDWGAKGAPAEEVEEALGAALRERRAHFRQRGFRDLLIALGLLLAGGVAFLACQAASRGEIRIGRKAYAILSLAVYGAPMAGILLGFRGVRRVFVGGETKEAASDIDDSD